MKDQGYKIRDGAATHFLTFGVLHGFRVFEEPRYADIVVESLRYRSQKGLILHAWVIMPDHVHLVARAREGNLSGVLRDLKAFTSRTILETLKQAPGDRERGMLKVFSLAGEINPRNKGWQFWQQDNRPKECHSPLFTRQKIDYVNFNPVRAGLVKNPEDYLYSSARDYRGEKGLVEVDPLYQIRSYP